jgi:hypothetical protein
VASARIIGGDQQRRSELVNRAVRRSTPVCLDGNGKKVDNGDGAIAVVVEPSATVALKVL